MRDAKINLHLFGILLQFFKSIKKKYETFHVLVNDNTFSLNPNRPYIEEFNALLIKASKVINFKSNQNYYGFKYKRDSSYIQISHSQGFKLNGEDFNISKNINLIFNKSFGLESKPLNFEMDKKILKKNHGLYQTLKKNFVLVFYPTFDPMLRYENKKRKFGVITNKNFYMMESIYHSILKKIEKNKINNFKILLLNKKSLGWKVNESIIDLKILKIMILISQKCWV